MNPSVEPAVIPVGGAVSLTLAGAVSGAWLLERATSGFAYVPIGSGMVPPTFYLDIGDGLPAPLNRDSFYQYRYTDVGGQTVTDWINPSVRLQTFGEPLTQILIRLIQAGVNAISVPSGISKIQVTQAMPLGGLPPLPMIVVNLDTMEQSMTPIGQSLGSLNYDRVSGTPVQQTITGLVNRMYRISVLSSNPLERDFYRDNAIGIFESLWGSVLQPLGIDVSHRWQVNSGQIADDKKAQEPGFYWSEIMMTFEGTLNVLITPTFGVIAVIDTTALNDAEGDIVAIEAIVPVPPYSGYPSPPH